MLRLDYDRNVLAPILENQKTLTEKIFRQINYLVISFVSTLVSRIFTEFCCLAYYTFMRKEILKNGK